MVAFLLTRHPQKAVTPTLTVARVMHVYLSKGRLTNEYQEFPSERGIKTPKKHRIGEPLVKSMRKESYAKELAKMLYISIHAILKAVKTGNPKEFRLYKMNGYRIEIEHFI